MSPRRPALAAAPLSVPARAFLARLVRALPVLAALAFAAAAAAPALAQQPADMIPTLMANGQGEVMVVPDIAIVTIAVVSRGANAADALTANSTDIQKVIDTIKGANVAEKDIATSGFAVSPIYQTVPRPPSDQPAPIIGYSVTNEVRVTIRNLATSGAILDQVVKSGANRVNGIQFDISDRKSGEDAATKAAIAEARHRGELMADAAGVRLVRVLSVTSSTGGGPPVPVFARDSFAAQAVPVQPGQRSVSAVATVTWEIGGK